MPKLQKLDLSGCKKLPDMNGDGFSNLNWLNLSYSKIQKLELKSMPKLQKLDLLGC
jgi:Leucine-rich repeat (LRR) protein